MRRVCAEIQVDQWTDTAGIPSSPIDNLVYMAVEKVASNGEATDVYRHVASPKQPRIP